VNSTWPPVRPEPEIDTYRGGIGGLYFRQTDYIINIYVGSTCRYHEFHSLCTNMKLLGFPFLVRLTPGSRFAFWVFCPASCKYQACG